jgi:hypothetical protein
MQTVRIRGAILNNFLEPRAGLGGNTVIHANHQSHHWMP